MQKIQLSRRISFSACSVMLGLVVCGCGGNDGPQRYEISGAVTYQGEAVRCGSILLKPDNAQGNSGPACYVEFVDGKFTAGDDEKGAVAGPHIAVIKGYDCRSTPEEQSEDDESLLPPPIVHGSKLFDEEVAVVIPEGGGRVDIEIATE